MKRIYFFITGFLLFCMVVSSFLMATKESAAFSKEGSVAPQENSQEPLKICRDEPLGVRILCDPNWPLEELKDGLMIVISEKPAVTLMITRVNSDIKFLGQITKENLKTIGQYADGFQIEPVMVGKEKALRVKAFPESQPQMRLTDYYLIHDDKLYGLFFSVNPSDEWENYKFLFDQLTKSFEFLK